MFEKKNIYHRELAEAGPTKVQLTGPIRKSKKGPTHFVPLNVWGDDSEHLFTIENDAVKAELSKVQQGVWVTVHARGGKGSESITVEYPAGMEPREPQSVEDAMVEAMWAAHRVNARLPMPYPPELEHSMGITMFIQNPMGLRPWKSGDTAAPSAPAPVESPPPKDVEFLDRVPGVKAHPDLTWRQIAEADPGYIDWAVRNMRNLTEPQREMLRNLLEEVRNPFYQDGENLFAEPAT